jgi:cyclophilin family peptidyl-prolyl cis-trans isomerase
MKRFLIAVILLLSGLSCFSQTLFPRIVLETSAGNMVFQLYDNTPLHCENFTKLVNEGYYNNQLFHRVIKDFMIQAGDPQSKGARPREMLGSGGPGYTIPAEFVKEYYHKRGALAAARQPDNVNPAKESSGSQFYIVCGRTFTEGELNAMVQRDMHIPFTPEQISEYTVHGGSPHLDYEYTVFGELIEGFDILDLIASSPVDRNNRPLDDVIILKAYTLK